MLLVLKRFGVRAVTLLALGAGLSACDKCGNRLGFNAPSLPRTCGDNTGPSR